MGKRVLDVGNCGPDHGAITSMLQSHFDADVQQAHAADEALAMLAQSTYDLVLVNRIFDRDGTSGMELVQQVKQQFEQTPVMLITNFAEHQTAAVAVGAEPGFGKNAVGSTETVQLLEKYLNADTTPN